MSDYAPFKIQRQAHKAFLVDNYKRGLLYWSRRCLGEGTLVLTPSGPVPIEKLKVGDAVYGYEDGLIVDSKVVETHNNGVQNTQAVIIGDKTIYATSDHRWLRKTYTDGLTSVGELSGRPQIKRQHVAIPCGRIKVPHAYAIGALVGDGCCTNTAVYDISSVDEEIVSNSAKVLGLKYGKRKSNNHTWFMNGAKKRKKDGTWEKATVFPEYNLWLRGKRANEKILDWSVINLWDRESCLNLLAGLIDTDGSVFVAGNTLRIQFGQQSESVIKTYKNLIYKLWQFPIKISEDRRTKYKNGPIFYCTITNNYYAKMILKELSPYLQCQRKKYKPEYSKLRSRLSDYISGKVESAGKRQTYDITVSNSSHLYLLADYGLISHNTGKTLWSVQQLMWSCMLNQGPHHIVFKEYQQAETVAWNQYLHLIPEKLIADKNKSTLTVTFQYFNGTVKFPEPLGIVELKADTSKPPATIRLLGSDKADSHRGGESYGMIFDEYQDQDTYGWDYVYKYFLATTNGWACFMGTAKAEDGWNEMLDRAENSYLDYPKGHLTLSDDDKDPINKRWYYSKATWRENPKIQPSWIAAERRQAELEGRLGPFLQETELIPFTQQGAVYPMFDKKIHNIKAEDIPIEGTNYIALDFGFAEGHPAAAAFIRIDREDVWYQWDEIHGTGIQIDELIGEIRMRMDGRNITGIIADSARPDLIEYMQSKGLPVIPAPKKQNSVPAGIQLLSQRLKPKIQIMGPPKPGFYIDIKNCPKTTYDFTHYRYKELKKDRHPMELPEKKFDDSLDAIRYLALHFKYGQIKDDKIPKAEIEKQMNSYGLI